MRFANDIFAERKIITDTYTIPVVGDDLSIVNIIDTVLKHEGYHVLTAHDGEEACHIVKTKHPHLIIMDVMIPKYIGAIVELPKIERNP